MEQVKIKSAPANIEKAPPAPPEINYEERIKSQVLAQIGKPPRLDRVEVNKHHGRKYRVNIWQQPEADSEIVVMASPRIGPSYYLTVSETGEILHSDPPLTKLGA